MPRSDGPTDPDSVAGGGSDLGTAATESTVRLTAEQEDALKVQAAAREGSTAFVREAAVERVQKVRCLCPCPCPPVPVPVPVHAPVRPGRGRVYGRFQCCACT